MAKPATGDNIERDESGPDFQATVALVRGKLRSNDSDQRSLAQDNATLFTRIEKQYGVHKGAAKTFSQIDKMATEKRIDYLRSLFGLLNFAGYDNFDDLVDRAQRPEGSQRKSGTAKPAPEKNKSVPDATDGVDPAVAAQRAREADPMFDADETNVHKLPVAGKPN